MLEKIEGIILKTQDYRETHKLITLFSKKIGKFTAISQGAKKPKSRMAAITQPFIQGEFLVYVRRGLSTIQQGEIINSFRPIREDIIKTAYAAYIAELTDKIMSDQQPEPFLYEQFLHTLTWIAEKDGVLIPMMMYELKLFQQGGFLPVVNQCVSCGGNHSPYAFSIQEGGLLCQQCLHIDPYAIALENSLARLLPIFVQVGLERVGNISVRADNQKKLRRLLDLYYERYGGYYLKTRKFLNQLDLLNDIN